MKNNLMTCHFPTFFFFREGNIFLIWFFEGDGGGGFLFKIYCLKCHLQFPRKQIKEKSFFPSSSLRRKQGIVFKCFFFCQNFFIMLQFFREIPGPQFRNGIFDVSLRSCLCSQWTVEWIAYGKAKNSSFRDTNFKGIFCSLLFHFPFLSKWRAISRGYCNCGFLHKNHWLGCLFYIFFFLLKKSNKTLCFSGTKWWFKNGLSDFQLQDHSQHRKTNSFFISDSLFFSFIFFLYSLLYHQLEVFVFQKHYTTFTSMNRSKGFSWGQMARFLLLLWLSWCPVFFKRKREINIKYDKQYETEEKKGARVWF